MSIEEKKKKGGKLKWIIIVIVLIAIIGTVAGGGSKEPKKVTSTNSDSTSVDNADDSTTSESVNTEPTDTDFGIGDTADFDGVRVCPVIKWLSVLCLHFPPSDELINLHSCICSCRWLDNLYSIKNHILHSINLCQ